MLGMEFLLETFFSPPQCQLRVTHPSRANTRLGMRVRMIPLRMGITWCRVLSLRPLPITQQFNITTKLFLLRFPLHGSLQAPQQAFRQERAASPAKHLDLMTPHGSTQTLLPPPAQLTHKWVEAQPQGIATVPPWTRPKPATRVLYLVLPVVLSVSQPINHHPPRTSH